MIVAACTVDTAIDSFAMFCRSLYTKKTYFCTRQLLHQKILRQEVVYTKAFTPEAFYTTSNSNQRTLTPETFYIRRLLQQNLSTPGTRTFYTKELLRQTDFTPEDFYTRKPFYIPVVPHKAVAEVSRIGNYRRDWLL